MLNSLGDQVATGAFGHRSLATLCREQPPGETWVETGRGAKRNMTQAVMKKPAVCSNNGRC